MKITQKVITTMSNRGLKFLDICIWNKVSISKCLWNLCKKKDKIQVEWVHIYNGTKRIWGTQCNQASWIGHRLLKTYKHLPEDGYDQDTVMAMDNYSKKKIYMHMRRDMVKVVWRKLVWSNHGALKWLFILFLPMNKRLER